MTVAEPAGKVEEEWDYLDRDEKFEWLIDRGKSLEANGTYTDADLVKGCQSKVWLQVSTNGDKVHIEGTSDALITKGIVGLLVELFDTAPTGEVKDFDFIAWLAKNEMSLSYQRMQGLAGMLQRIRMTIK